ncbi:hypothetical protein TraAM80_03461 [Trypanosoma rangeli]|uniref:Uncharacterized protein n=1 Tax=Trypanosoma rangeli TaxID=5698 RepID=A0A3R7KIV9_TRYRA|nr:uncharacterized protein TraAM80_03461 [Trypanosoma rangeli]RNF07325.1 hypothetical protein TraAM80_03461 [Trypanosoma rangeli]|eukprot:RNF07325.1 hypothetical protein TraAM80_03461 [Trypanosoma rangeli]
MGTTMFDFGIQGTMLSIFSFNRGASVATAKAFNVLGFPIFAAIRLAFFNKHLDHFFYFLVALVMVIAVAYMLVIRLPPYHLTGYQQSHLSEEEKQGRLTTQAQYLRQKTPTPRFVVGLFFVPVFIVFMPLQGALVVSYGIGQRHRVAFAVITIALVVLNCAIVPSPRKILDREGGHASGARLLRCRYRTPQKRGNATSHSQQ